MIRAGATVVTFFAGAAATGLTWDLMKIVAKTAATRYGQSKVAAVPEDQSADTESMPHGDDETLDDAE